MERKKKKMKRLIPAILALVMLFCLCACGSSASVSTEAAQSAEIDAPENSAPADLLAQADALIAAGETEENLDAALELYQTALDSDPENLGAILGSVDVMIRKGNFENALNWLKTYTLTMPDNPVITEKIRELESGNIKDRDGKTRRESGFYPDGRLQWTLSYAYNEDGKAKEVVLRDGEGKELDRAELTYDDHGYPAKTFFKVRGLDNMLSIKKKNVTNTYDERGNLIVREDDEGRHWDMTYDENDHLLKEICYMNGKLLSEEIHQYNESGLEVFLEYTQSGKQMWTEAKEYNDDGDILKYERHYIEASSSFEYETRLFEYENGKQVREVWYHDGELYRTQEYEYDENGETSAIYVYDADGNMIESNTLIPRASTPSRTPR